MTRTDGLHHITAISGNAATTQDFYTLILGQRLVKRTVNFDDPGTWHLYYGDARGSAGSIMTFFPFEGARPGRVGAGMVTLSQYAIPPGALDYWSKRLADHGVETRTEESLFGERRLLAEDPDGLPLALVEAEDARAPWTTVDIGAAVAIRGFHGVTVSLRAEDGTTAVMTRAFGYTRDAVETQGAGTVTRYRASGPGVAGVFDLVIDPTLPAGRPDAGTVHHVAFSVPDRTTQDAVRTALTSLGQQVTPSIDRNYFWAIYARLPGHVLFEVATEEPGFLTDETAEALGTTLQLPPQHEPRRAEIVETLPPLDRPT